MRRCQEIDELFKEGYILNLESDCTGCCDKWLEAWDLIKGLFAEGIAKDIPDLDKKYNWKQYPTNFVQFLEMELHNAGMADTAYHHKRIVFCQELIQWSGKDELLASNARISMAETYFELGAIATAGQLYQEWLRDDPDWGWGYIGWSDHYRFNCEGKQYEKAEELLLTGYARDGLRDRISVAERLMELYEEMGEDGKAKEFTKIYSGLQAAELARRKPEAALAVKTGRNDPCPCGSGKKYKKCCGA